MSKKSRKKFLCLDCSVDTGKIHEHYFINTDLWLQATGSIVGMVCIGCLENRIGRTLNKHDFPDVTINNPRYEPKSERLMDRLKKS